MTARCLALLPLSPPPLGSCCGPAGPTTLLSSSLWFLGTLVGFLLFFFSFPVEGRMFADLLSSHYLHLFRARMWKPDTEDLDR